MAPASTVSRVNRSKAGRILRWLLFAGAVAFSLYLWLILFMAWIMRGVGIETGDEWMMPVCWGCVIAACLAPCGGNRSAVWMMAGFSLLLLLVMFGSMLWPDARILDWDFVFLTCVFIITAALIRFRPGWNRARPAGAGKASF